MHLNIYACAIVSFALLAKQALSQQPTPNFSTSGAARVFYEPDAYDLAFGIVTEDSDIQTCKQQHMGAVKSVSDFIAENKGRVFSLKQDATELETVFPNNTPKTRFVRFTTNYTARVKDPKALAAFQEGLITSGVTNLYRLDLFSEKLPELIDQARKQAIADAKHKAALAAKELDWKLIGPRHIHFKEAESPWISANRASSGMASRAYNYDRNDRPELTTYVYSAVDITFEYEARPMEGK